ncbi:MAG: hypothetical protein V1904_02385 [Bacteroidota bacterium]
MPFVISFALSLLALAAGLLLLIKAKQDTGKFLKIMSWIIISCGILAVLLSIHMAILRHIVKHNHDCTVNDNMIYFNHKLPFEKFIPFCEDIDSEFSWTDDGEKNVKVIVKKETADSDFDPEEQSKAVVKIVSDNVTLTSDQEKKIKNAIEQSFKIAKEFIPEEKEVVKETK